MKLKKGKSPERMKSHNAISWAKIERALNSQSPLSSEILGTLVSDHQSGDERKPGGDNFVKYCVKMGWLKEE